MSRSCSDSEAEKRGLAGLSPRVDATIDETNMSGRSGMTGMSTDDSDEGGAAAFDAVSDEVRLGVIKAFVEERSRRRETLDLEDRDDITDDVVLLSFSELWDAVGIEDSGRFNYHLDKLVGRFVHRTPKGYMLTVAGHRLAGSIVAGRYETTAAAPERVDRYCPACGSQLTAMYTGGALSLLCENDHGSDQAENDDAPFEADEDLADAIDEMDPADVADADMDTEEMMAAVRRTMGDTVAIVPLPPAAFERRDIEDAIDVGIQIRRNRGQLMADGVCPECRGQFDRQLVKSDQPLMTVAGYQVKGICRDCGTVNSGDIRETLLSHPAVSAFFWERGVDVRDRFSDEAVLPTENSVGERSTNPLTLAVTYECDGDELTIVVDETVTVINTA
jgi:hypothetical protein